MHEHIPRAFPLPKPTYTNVKWDDGTVYRLRWGAPDDHAWERAHDAYLHGFDHYSDIQEQRPLPLVQLELGTRQ